MEKYGKLDVSWAQGYKGDDIHHVNVDTLCYHCGSNVKFIDITNKTESSFFSPGNGIKKIATNPFQSVFAIAEHCLKPRIFVYHYPSLEQACIFSDGAELEYTNIAFSTTNSMIVACSGVPDFTLFLWNWSNGELKCKEKLLSEDLITSVVFNPLNHDQLSLIGPNKVTVWTLETCNTVSTFNSKKVILPTTDGIVYQDDDNLTSRSVTRLGYTINIPSVIKAGLHGKKADTFVSPHLRHTLVEPTAQCWSNKGEVYVGCKDGQLFRVDCDSGLSTLVLGGSTDALLQEQVNPGMFMCMAYNSQGIIAGGKDRYFRRLSMTKNNRISIEKLWRAAQVPTSLTYNPKDYSDLYYGTDEGVIFKFELAQPESVIVSETHCGKFVGVAYGGAGKFCLTCRQNGVVQVWDHDDGELLGGIHFKDKAVSMAYCPSCPVLVVGTSSGKIRYVDTSSLHSEEIDIRQVFCQKIHHAPVDFLKYDSYGTFLLSASKEESYIFVFNSTPSSRFNCLGYVDCGGLIRDLSVFPDEDKLMVTAVIAYRDEPNQANEVVVFTLKDFLRNDEEGNYNSLRKDFHKDIIDLSRYALTISIDSAVITSSSDVIELAAISHHNKTLHKFNLLPSQGTSSEEVYAPISHHPGHQLGGGKLVLSPHRGWLASTSKDGAIMMRDLKDWDSFVSITPHSFMENGTRDFAFSPDCKHVVTVGADDDSLCCLSWEFSQQGSIVANSAVDFYRGLNMRLRNTIEQESNVLDEMQDLVSPRSSPQRTLDTLIEEGESKREEIEGEAADEEQKEEKKEEGKKEDGESQKESAETFIESMKEESQTVEEASEEFLVEKTWLDVRTEIATQHENSKYDEKKNHLKSEIDKLRTTILEMMAINQDLPELEQLKQEEFNLDIEEQKRMRAQQDKEIQEVRDEINLENLAQRYLAYLIKKECWDDMECKGRALKTFSQTTAVHNYPLTPITKAENTLLENVTKMRQIEIAEYAVRKSIVDTSTSKTSIGEEEEEEEDDQSVGLALHGSLGPKYNGESDLFYSQFELHTREEKMIQIVLIKNAIRRVKEAFNNSFNSVFKNKEQEIARIKERNIRIRTIMQELDIDTMSLVDPEMDKDENPEMGFDVTDSEVTVERVLSEKQQREKEEQERMEEERKAAAKGDNKRERALMDMMGGVLEVKKEDILKQDIPLPEFAQLKEEKDWAEEEKKKMKEYEKKLKDLQEEREKYRKNLENELKKLQQSNVDAMAAYDESLTILFNKKVKVEMVVNQEELKILRLTNSLITDDELSTYEAHLNFLLELKNSVQSKASALETDIRKRVEDYREFYDGVVAEDKMLDRSFKRDFSDIPLSLSDQLYKLFRRRPRIQRQHTKHNEEKTISYDPYGIHDKISTSTLGGESTALRQGLAELDHVSHMPEGVDETLWQRLCDSRQAKFESELRAKQCAMTLAEMTQYLQHRQEELEKLTREIDDVIKQQTKLYEDMMKNTLNLEVQLLLKQGQVEVPCGQFIPDYSESILIHRGVVEDLNGTIRTLGESKVAAMTESKDFKKGIHQLEWDRKRMSMQMEDLHNKARHIQMLKLTKEIQAFLNEDNHPAKQAKEIAVLEQTLVLQDKQLEANLDQKNDITSLLTRRLRMKEDENKELDKVLEELHISVSERQNISNVNAAERAMNTADKRLRGIVQRRKLVDLAKAQAQEVAVLRAEVERLRMKTFPALVQVER